MHLLIHGLYPDIHTDAVAWALRKHGHQVDIWRQADFPSRQRISVHLEPGRGCEWHISSAGMDLSRTNYDLVWYRRPAEPVISDEVSEADRLMAFREADSHLRGLDNIIAPRAVWINDPANNRRASNKIYQLDLAARCDLPILPTIFSNHPQEIREFAGKFAPIIYKPFYQASWVGKAGSRSLLTTKVDIDDLQHDASLAACPGIFQQFVQKAFEVRATFMGDECIAIQIGGYANELAATDWRSWGHSDAVKFGPAILPEPLLGRCRNYMKALGLRFGCIDFIVDEDGQYYFLEINPAGQFLWVEDAVPEIPVLEKFCKYLLSLANEDVNAFGGVSLADFVANQGNQDDQTAQHVISTNPFHYADVQ